MTKINVLVNQKKFEELKAFFEEQKESTVAVSEGEKMVKFHKNSHIGLTGYFEGDINPLDVFIPVQYSKVFESNVISYITKELEVIFTYSTNCVDCKITVEV